MSAASSTLSVLRRVRLRLSDEAAWTKRAVARDANGNAVGFYHERAVAWCLVGAVDVETSGTPTRGEVLTLLGRLIDPRIATLADYNDVSITTHAHVHALLDRAIAEASREGAS